MSRILIACCLSAAMGIVGWHAGIEPVLAGWYAIITALAMILMDDLKYSFVAAVAAILMTAAIDYYNVPTLLGPMFYQGSD